MFLCLPVPVPQEYPTHYQEYGFYTGTGYGLLITCTRTHGYRFCRTAHSAVAKHRSDILSPLTFCRSAPFVRTTQNASQVSNSIYNVLYVLLTNATCSRYLAAHSSCHPPHHSWRMVPHPHGHSKKGCQPTCSCSQGQTTGGLSLPGAAITSESPTRLQPLLPACKTTGHDTTKRWMSEYLQKGMGVDAMLGEVWELESECFEGECWCGQRWLQTGSRSRWW